MLLSLVGLVASLTIPDIVSLDTSDTYTLPLPAMWKHGLEPSRDICMCQVRVNTKNSVVIDTMSKYEVSQPSVFPRDMPEVTKVTCYSGQLKVDFQTLDNALDALALWAPSTGIFAQECDGQIFKIRNVSQVDASLIVDIENAAGLITSTDIATKDYPHFNTPANEETIKRILKDFVSFETDA
jgi:hypothetical protein